MSSGDSWDEGRGLVFNPIYQAAHTTSASLKQYVTNDSTTDVDGEGRYDDLYDVNNAQDEQESGYIDIDPLRETGETGDPEYANGNDDRMDIAYANETGYAFLDSELQNEDLADQGSDYANIASVEEDSTLDSPSVCNDRRVVSGMRAAQVNPTYQKLSSKKTAIVNSTYQELGP